MKRLNRRELLRAGGAIAAAGQVSVGTMAAAPSTSSVYASIGVRPLINCKGTFTIVSGSQSLPEVKRAMEEASRNYVHMDELMDAVGKRLAELTQAEWGAVTAGCAAALTHSTAACIAGADPEKLQRLPNLTGLKNEVVVPRYSRNVYDHAVRMLGVKMVEVNSPAEMESAFNARTAMVMILADVGDDGPMGTAAFSKIAKARGVPLIVDAAAERLTIPNIHLGRGADLVAYSGGKCLRGPQCAGLLLGRKDLVKAAWLHSAPHHAFGRSLKVGKEEIMGMLAAVEAWTKRDHKAEWRQWEGWLEEISSAVTKVSGVKTRVLQPQGLSNNAPRLMIEWDGVKLGITGTELEKKLYNEDPRIVLGGANGDRRQRDRGASSSATIMPYMMQPGDAPIVAARMAAVLAKPPKSDWVAPPQTAPAQVSGHWDVRVDFFLGSADHELSLEQQGADLTGIHRGDILASELRGVVEGNQVRFRSSHRYEGTRLGYDFEGRVEGDAMAGTVDLGEYGQAKWTARKHKFGQPGGLVRPIKNV